MEGQGCMLKQFINKLRSINLWHLVWITVLAEFFTCIMNAIMGLIWWGRTSTDLLIIGAIDALFVSLIIGPIVIYVFQRLHESEKKYRMLTDNADDAICIMDADGNFLDVNKKAEELSGYKKEELLQMNFLQFHPEEELTRVKDAFKECFTRGSGALDDVVMLRKDGSAVSVDISGRVIEDRGRKAVQTIIRDITERKISQAELWLLKEAVESMPIGLTITDTNGKIIYTNPAEAKMHGYEINELINREARLFAPSERWKKLSLGQLNPIEAWHRESVNIRKDGHVFPVNLISVPVIDDKDRTLGIITLSEDLSERQKTEEALRRSEFSSLVLNSMNDAVSIIDAVDYSIARVNSTFLKELGVTEEEVIGKTCHSVTHNLSAPCDNFGHSCPLADTVMTGKYSVAEHVHFRSNGQEMYVEVSASPIKDQNGRVVQIVHVARDITWRKIAEEALFESEERFRQIFEQNEDALFLFKPETGEIIDVNPAAAALYGYTLEEFIGNDLSLLIEPSEQKKFMHFFSDLTSASNIRIDQTSSLRKDGTKTFIAVRGKIIRLRESDVLYCSFRDITEKIRLQEEAQLIQSKLIQTNKMTSLGTLVSGVAHEVNNPNNFILFNVQLLSETWQDAIKVLSEYYRDNGDFQVGGIPFSEMREIIPKLLSGIDYGSHRIKNIVENLRDFARQDKADLGGQVSIKKVITSAAGMLNNQISRYTDNFGLALEEGLPEVKGSGQQLEQVIMNLIMNALQALPDRKRGVQISTRFDTINNCVVIEVKDEGTGMSEEILNRIMEPFFTTRLEQGGTGLGLSISYSIIKDHCGSMKFKSAPGRGTTVNISLPVWEE